MEQKKESLIYDRGEIKPGLERISRLLDIFGDPQNKVKVIHIAGTNGKGSTGMFIRKTLSLAGYRAGHYQTPAVFDPLEIISIDGKKIKKKAYESLKNEIARAADENMADDPPSVFERECAAAYIYFEREKCDICVIEAGIGGLYDATNVSGNTVLSVITPIGMDHMEYLGNTVKEIAFHKAGIIRTGVPVVTAPQVNDALEVITKKAQEVNAPLYITKTGEDLPYRKINEAVALEAVNVLSGTFEGLKALGDKDIKKAFSRVRPFGRFYRAGSNPVFILDGAHNIPAAQALRKNILLTFKDKEVIYITGAFKDKEYVETIKTAAVNSKTVFTVTAPGDRGLDAHILSGRLQEAGLLSVPKDSVKEAVGAACLFAEKENMPVIAFGSLSWLKEAKKQYDNRKKGFR